MISKKKLQKAHSKLMNKVKTDTYYKIETENRTNVYICDHGHKTKTIDVDPGCTPFYHKCHYCESLGKSTMYMDIAPELDPVEEWYRPDFKECMKKWRKTEGAIEHILNGGLVPRPIKGKNN